MRLSRRFAVPAAIAAVTLSLASSTQGQPSEDLTLQTADGPRHAIVVRAGPGPHPTVLVLHGALGTGAQTERSTGFAEAAAARGFTAVFPDGLNRQWHDGRRGGGDGPDDIGFLRALVARLMAEHAVAPGRIYIAGISNGGMMSFTMACKAGDLFAGVGTVIANMPAGIEPCLLKPGPLVMVNGTADPMVPFAGGEVGLRGGRGEVWSVQQTADLFSRADGCAHEGEPRALPHTDHRDATTVTRIAWRGCRHGTSVTLFRIEGGGHALPGRPPLALGLLGPSNHDISAAEVIMDVFAGR